MTSSELEVLASAAWDQQDTASTARRSTVEIEQVSSPTEDVVVLCGGPLS